MKERTKDLINELIRRGAVLVIPENYGCVEIVKREKYSQKDREEVLLKNVLLLDGLSGF